MKFDLARFRKVKTTEKSTTLRHPDGHVIEISHENIRPQVKKQLDALPTHLADGGEANQDQALDAIPQIDALPNQQTPEPSFAETLGAKLKDKIADGSVKEGALNAIGGGLFGTLKKNLGPVADDQLEKFSKGLEGNEPKQETGSSTQAPPNIKLTDYQPQQPDQQDQMPAVPQENPYDIEQRAAQEYTSNIDKINDTYGKIAPHVQNDIQSTVREIQDGKTINPNAYVENMSAGHRMTSAIGLILGGMGAGLTGGENPALKFLNAQIERNVDAQKANIAQKNNILAAQLHQFGNMKDATDMTLAIEHARVASEFQRAGAMSNDPNYRLRALQNYQNYMSKANTLAQGVTARNAIRHSGVDPAMQINAQASMGFMTPHEAEEAHKELTNMQILDAGRKEALDVFKGVLKDSSILGRLNPQTYARIAAQVEPIAQKLARDASGRVNVEEMAGIKKMMPGIGNDMQTIQTKLKALDSFTAQKMKSSLLDSHGIKFNVTPFLLQSSEQPSGFNRGR